MPLDHLFGAGRGDLVLYASQLEALLEQAIWRVRHDRADHTYRDSLDAVFHQLRGGMVVKEAERSHGTTT